MSEDHPSRTLVPVHVCWTDAEAEVVLSYLASNGIAAVVGGASMPKSVLPFTVDGMGQITLEVEDSRAEEAKALLAARETETEQS